MRGLLPKYSRTACIALLGSALPWAGWAQSVSTTTITATVVASSCVGRVVTGLQRSSSGTVDFGVINPKTRTAPVRTFSLLLSEYEGGETGCSAFEAYGRVQNVATLTFGDLSQTQLDTQGVVTRYSDDSASPIRVQVVPTNSEAQFVQSGGPGYITAGFNQVQYPIDFAAKGQFDFSAALAGLERARAGAFSGTLTLTVVYR